VDDVASVHSEVEDVHHSEPPSKVNGQGVHTDADATPSEIPPGMPSEPALEEDDESQTGQKQFLGKLGGYGWRG
jgi:hypothetical protein